MPLFMLFPSREGDCLARARKGKEDKKKKWMLVDRDLNISTRTTPFVDDKQVVQRILNSLPQEERRRIVQLREEPQGFVREVLQPHNTINRQTWTTGTGDFAPFTTSYACYAPSMKLALLALLDEAATSIENVLEGLRRIGLSGFGKDASTGKGRFQVEAWAELTPPEVPDANACYCLSPCVPVPNSFEQVFFAPFIRYGRHGDRLASSSRPFKNPVIMADDGAVFIPKDPSVFKRLYWGCAVTGISKIQPGAVMQGYTICLPMKLEGVDD